MNSSPFHKLICDKLPSSSAQKKKLQLAYDNIILNKKLAILGLNNIVRNDWTGFDKSVPEFSGEDEHFDLSQFIFVIETNINQLKKIGYEISEEQIAYSIVNKLKPNSIASSYYINYMKTQAKNNATPSWQSIKEHLGNLMNSASKQLDLRSKLRRLKAGNSITKYNNEFMKISFNESPPKALRKVIISNKVQPRDLFLNRNKTK